MKGMNRLQFAKHKWTCSVLSHLGACSVCPIAHNMLLRSWLAFWGCMPPRLLPKEGEGLFAWQNGERLQLSLLQEKGMFSALVLLCLPHE